MTPQSEIKPKAERRRPPLVVGLGLTGQRVVTRLASTAGHEMRLLAIATETSRQGPAAVPTIQWPMADESQQEAADELRERAGSTPAAVVVLGLGAFDPALIAPAIAQALRPARSLAVVGVAPFSFEGHAKLEAAKAVMHEVGSMADLFAIAARDDIRNIAPGDTPLEQALQLVDNIATEATEAIARALARRKDTPERIGVCSLGAATARGPNAPAEAVKNALLNSLLRQDRLSACSNAFLALAMGRTPTIGEIADAEDMLRELLAPHARLTFEIAMNPSLEDKALSAICISTTPAPQSEELFPSDDPTVLDVPAFLRRRSAGRGCSVARAKWLRSA